MKFAVAVLAAVALCHVHGAPALQSSLIQTLQSQGSADIMVVLKTQVAPVVQSINNRRFATSGAKTTQLVAELRAFTQASQQPILSFLQEKSNSVKPFWITNRISVKKATLAVVEGLLEKFADQIEEIREAKVIQLDIKPVEEPTVGAKVLEWGVSTVQAPAAWEQGITGRGVVVSAIDTGVRASHEALKNIRALYSWFDASVEQSQVPVDAAGHGTHVTGTIAGTGGTGVAPDSEWIHCRAFEPNGQATEEALLTCAQWVTCPTLPDGTNEDCTQKPAVVSNSWGGGNNDPFYNDAINAWHASDITPVFAIGNSGPGCRTANSPGDQPNVISVGASNAQNLIAQFSSHGPNRDTLAIKPEVSAPGNNIRSASHYGDRLYVVMSGTSMACPHVAGSVALLKQKNPAATFAEIERALESKAFHPELTEILCTGGGVNMTNYPPSNSHGWGNVRVADALGAI